MACGGLGAVVEDPYNLCVSVRRSVARGERAYGDHGKQDVAGSGGLEGCDGRVDQRIDRGSGEDESGGEEADNLCMSAGASGDRFSYTYRDMVGPLGITRDSDCDADNAEEHEHQRPPGEVGEAAVDGGYYAGDKGNDPRKLRPSALGRTRSTCILTIPIEMVASAKGSPMMRPTLKDEARWLL